MRLHLILIFLCCHVLFTICAVAEPFEGKLYVKTGSGTACKQQDFFMEPGGQELKFNFLKKEMIFQTILDLAEVDYFSISEDQCNTELRVTKRILRRSKITEVEINGHNRCFFFQMQDDSEHTLCAANDSFPDLYSSLVTSIGRYAHMDRSIMQAHKKLVTFYTTYTDFSNAIFRAKEEDALAGQRPNPMKGQKTPQNVGYKIKRMIGKGGGGRVFAAEKIRFVKRKRLADGTVVESTTPIAEGESQLPPIEMLIWPVVYKTIILRSGDAINSEAVSGVKEAKIYSLLGRRHKNILKLYDAMTYKDEVGLILEQGDRDLLDWQSNDPPTFNDLEEVYKIAREILAGLRFMHKRKVFHFDMKPENVLIKIDGGRMTDNGERDGGVPLVKIMDFGLSRAKVLDTETDFYTLLPIDGGTANYNSPERVRRSNPMEACPDDHCLELQDAYAAGMTIFDALIGPIIGHNRPLKFNSWMDRENRRYFHNLYQPAAAKEEISERGLTDLYEIALKLTTEDPRKRITVSRALSKLRRSTRRAREAAAQDATTDSAPVSQTAEDPS